MRMALAVSGAEPPDFQALCWRSFSHSEKPPPKEILATRLGKLRLRKMNLAAKSSESSDYRCGLRLFAAETPSTERPKNLFGPHFPRNPHFPALRSGPMALSGASSRKQILSIIPSSPAIFLAASSRMDEKDVFCEQQIPLNDSAAEARPT